MKTILNIVGARPNFMKIAPIQHQIEKSDKLTPVLIHTGQHYDEKMSKVFFDELGMPQPDVYLGVGSGTHAVQTASIMVGLEKEMQRIKPDLVLVVGDVNSTVAAAIDAAKLHIPVAHVEAGLRSNDRNMPEEINRVLTDSISNFLFVTEQSGLDNLKSEGISSERVHFVGNVMIDSLVANLQKARQSAILEQLEISAREYCLVTIHRPNNVDNPENLDKILSAFEVLQAQKKIVFPIHPRTRKRLSELGFEDRVKKMKNLILLDPIGYLDFMRLMEKAVLVLTDSGGIQEETTYLGVPCLTLRENTERPVTVSVGTNQLIGMDTQEIIFHAQAIMAGKTGKGQIPELWDGHAAERIVRILEDKL